MTALATAVAVAALLPLAGAFAGPAGDTGLHGTRIDSGVREQSGAREDDGVRDDGDVRTDDKAESKPAGTVEEKAEGREPGLLSGLGLTTAARCGPELASPDGVEAQTCVLSQAHDTWARTYYRNATGEELRSVLTLMGPEGRTVQMYCVVGAGDEPGACETPREPSRGAAEAYTAVAEFAAEGEADGDEPALLLRSGSNSVRTSGS
ncbi:hypothetical protein [Streptomyces sp. NBC_01304]|uniref:hypothetical protein n=1 Tax=Streptomyces sp. NBC_01304 TaxID=2903818 RepID=UPI002E162B6B|nr:hypothetical protein OG430_25510 [Streptomyces sp. NBC_01304]